MGLWDTIFMPWLWEKRFDELEARLVDLRGLIFSQFVPGEFEFIENTSERMVDMITVLKYEAGLPTVPADKDITRQHVVVTSDGVPVVIEGVVQEFEPALEDTIVTFEVVENSSCVISNTYYDSDDNASEQRTQDFTATDTIGPDAPGEFGALKNTGERQIDE